MDVNIDQFLTHWIKCRLWFEYLENATDSNLNNLKRHLSESYLHLGQYMTIEVESWTEFK